MLRSVEIDKARPMNSLDAIVIAVSVVI